MHHTQVALLLQHLSFIQPAGQAELGVTFNSKHAGQIWIGSIDKEKKVMRTYQQGDSHLLLQQYTWRACGC